MFVAGQPLDWKLFAGGRPLKGIRAQLDEFVAHLDERARADGAAPLSDTDSAIIIRKRIR
ncbi:MAG: hypothetical protein GTO28_00380, partial [Gammaproteobacteria bacterium]|nr:hypothetical protein [Gammaproteobacteria bacterium]NIR18280.1 hypothetical protein [Gammaproteobacteria bacterium]